MLQEVAVVAPLPWSPSKPVLKAWWNAWSHEITGSGGRSRRIRAKIFYKWKSGAIASLFMLTSSQDKKHRWDGLDGCAQMEKGKKSKGKVKTHERSGHPNLLNIPSLCEILPPLFSLRRKNHKGTRFCSWEEKQTEPRRHGEHRECKKKARFRLVVFKLHVSVIVCGENLAGRTVGMIHSWCRSVVHRTSNTSMPEPTQMKRMQQEHNSLPEFDPPPPPPRQRL